MPAKRLRVRRSTDPPASPLARLAIDRVCHSRTRSPSRRLAARIEMTTVSGRRRCWTRASERSLGSIVEARTTSGIASARARTKIAAADSSDPVVMRIGPTSTTVAPVFSARIAVPHAARSAPTGRNHSRLSAALRSRPVSGRARSEKPRMIPAETTSMLSRAPTMRMSATAIFVSGLQRTSAVRRTTGMS